MLIEEARNRIQTSQLINRLQSHALGQIDMTKTQIRAAEVLLRKRMPDLAVLAVATEDGPISIQIVRFGEATTQVIDAVSREIAVESARIEAAE